MTNDTARAAFEAKFLPRGYKPGTIKYHHAWHGYVVSRAESDAIVDRLVGALEFYKNAGPSDYTQDCTFESDPIGGSILTPGKRARAALQATEEYRKGKVRG